MQLEMPRTKSSAKYSDKWYNYLAGRPISHVLVNDKGVVTR